MTNKGMFIIMLLIILLLWGETECLNHANKRLEARIDALETKLLNTQLLTCDIGNQLTEVSDIVILYGKINETNLPIEVRRMEEMEKSITNGMGKNE